MASKHHKDPETEVESKPAPERHPAEPAPATPGVAQGDQQAPPPTEPPPPPDVPVSKDEAVQLFRSGHKLRKAGDPPEKWFQASRIAGVLVLCIPVDADVEESVLGQDLVLAD